MNETTQNFQACRNEMVAEISSFERTSSLLAHMAQAIRENPSTPRGALFPADAVGALLEGSDVVAEAALNRRHCVAIWDRLIAQPVPEPNA